MRIKLNKTILHHYFRGCRGGGPALDSSLGVTYSPSLSPFTSSGLARIYRDDQEVRHTSQQPPQTKHSVSTSKVILVIITIAIDFIVTN